MECSMDCCLPGSSVHGILQARILEWVAIPFSRGSSRPKDWSWVSCIAGRLFTVWATREAQLPMKPYVIRVPLCVLAPLLLKIFIYITATSLIQGRHDLVVARSMWDLSSPARDWTCISPIARQVVNHWTTREVAAAAAAKSLQSCPTLCDPIDGSPPGSPIPGILQARTLEWVAISFSNAWKWKVKGKSLSCVGLFGTPWTVAYQAPLSMGFSRQEYWSGVPLPSPGDLPNPGIKPGSPT